MAVYLLPPDPTAPQPHSHLIKPHPHPFTPRSHGQHPLRVLVLGPAAAGKTTVGRELAGRFGMPHINVGDLLYDEVARKTELGLEAKVFMDASKTVPDKWVAPVSAFC